MERLHVKIEGLVQGVFFRDAAKKKAEEMNITGWIKNKNDGTIEAVFEGEVNNLNKMLEFCREGPPDAVVDIVEEEWEDATEEFDTFEIEF
jgi:acylphosphatase